MKEGPAVLPPARERLLQRYLALLRRTKREDIAAQIASILWAPIPAWEDRGARRAQ